MCLVVVTVVVVVVVVVNAASKGRRSIRPSEEVTLAIATRSSWRSKMAVARTWEHSKGYAGPRVSTANLRTETPDFRGSDPNMRWRARAPTSRHPWQDPQCMLVCLECDCYAHADGTWVSWTYSLVHVFFKAHLVPAKMQPASTANLRNNIMDFQRVWLKQNLNLKGWNSHVHGESPGISESANLSRDNLSREIGRRHDHATVSFDRDFKSIVCLSGKWMHARIQGPMGLEDDSKHELFENQPLVILYYTILYYTILYCSVV